MTDLDYQAFENFEALLRRAYYKMLDMKMDLEACEEEISGEGFNDPDLNDLLAEIIQSIT